MELLDGGYFWGNRLLKAMNADRFAHTKPATKSSTIRSAIAAILAPIVALVTVWLTTGEVPMAMLLVEVPIIITQGKIIAERFKPNRTAVKGLV